MKPKEKQQGKIAAIVAYITIFGTIIAFFLNNDAKNSLASFHIRQALGVNLGFYMLGAFVAIFSSWMIDVAFYIFIVVLWGYGLIGAVKEEKNSVPILGGWFQKWFTFVT